MARLLYVECSPRKQDSASIEACRAFLDAYREAHPDDIVETLDIWSVAMPEFDGDAMAAKYAMLSGRPLTPTQASAWQRVEALAAPLHAADKLLFGIPLRHFGIPYKLRQLIDVITHDKVLFTFDGTSFSGKLVGKKAVVVHARGLDYSSPGSFTPGREYDLQRPYVEMWPKFVGIADVTGILVERTLLGPNGPTDRVEATEIARVLARSF